MKVTLEPLGAADFYQLEDLSVAAAKSLRLGMAIYTWKTACRVNWLEAGASIVDSLGLVLVPPGLPATIDLAGDVVED